MLLRCYGKMEGIIDNIDHAKKGRIMNVKKNFCAYMYKQCNKLKNEQKTYEDNHRNILFDSAMSYIGVP
jgi:hypothetical protein